MEIEDDLIISRQMGEFTLQDMKEYFALAARISQEGPVYSIGDMTKAAGISAEARRYAVANSPEARIVCNIVFGVSPAMRALYVLLLRASRLLGRAKSETAVDFVVDEAAARAVVKTLRARVPTTL
jgi:hypothetical protein